MNILISGFKGYIGLNLIKKLKGTRHKTFNLEKGLSVEEIVNVIKLNRIDCIINVVGILKETNENTFESSHIEVVNRLLEASNKSNLKLFVHISALGVGENIKTKYFESKEKAEELIKSSGIPYTIVRPCMVFGKGDKSISSFLGNMKKFHIFPILGGGKYLIQPLHIDDLTSLIVNIVDNPKYENRVVEIAGPKTYMFKEMLKALKKSKKVKALFINIPMFIAKLIAKIGNKINLPIDSDRLTMLIKGNYLRRRKNNSIIQITGIKRLDEI